MSGSRRDARVSTYQRMSFEEKRRHAASRRAPEPPRILKACPACGVSVAEAEFDAHAARCAKQPRPPW